MIVTISRQLGSGGDEIAGRVAAFLGLLLADREFIRSAARLAGVSDELLSRLMYERERTLATDLLESLQSTSSGVPGRAGPPQNPLSGIFAPMMPPIVMRQEDGVQVLGLVIKDLASRGNALILGQGGQVWLRGYRGVCHVQILAPIEARVQRVASREGLTYAKSVRIVRANDRARSDYLARFHGVNWLDPLLYHVVINTEHMAPEAAASLIVHAAQVIGQGA